MIQFVPQYLVAVIGLGVGAAAGIVLAAAMRRRPAHANRLVASDAWIAVPLLLAAVVLGSTWWYVTIYSQKDSSPPPPALEQRPASPAR